MSTRRATTVVGALVTVSSLAVGCGTSSPPPPDTVGEVTLDSVATTLLPDVVISYVPDDTLAPGTLFAGLMCNALADADFGSATLSATRELADDLCGFDVRQGGVEYTVLVRARTATDLQQPAPSGEEIEALSGIGLDAVGVIRGDDTYEVIVQVEQGYFSVTAPDRATARALARAAAERAADF
jgi:hypothetical protein